MHYCSIYYSRNVYHDLIVFSTDKELCPKRFWRPHNNEISIFIFKSFAHQAGKTTSLEPNIYWLFCPLTSWCSAFVICSNFLIRWTNWYLFLVEHSLLSTLCYVFLTEKWAIYANISVRQVPCWVWNFWKAALEIMTEIKSKLTKIRWKELW